MKALSFLLTVALFIAFQSFAYAGAWVRNSTGKWFYFPSKWCSEFIIQEQFGERCVDCCAVNGVPVTPITHGQVQIATKKLGNGDLEIYDSSNNELIIKLKAAAVADFDGVVYYSESQGFGMKKQADGKTYLVSDDGETSFQLSAAGIAAMQKEEEKTTALVANEQK
jgi:hypothetical protein